MTLLAIDPGTTESGWVRFDGVNALSCGTTANHALLEMIAANSCDVLAVEMIASYGMAVGREVFETCRWIGRFQQVWRAPADVLFVYRNEVKLHLCHSARAKDANIRQALIDRLGAPGTKKNPGPTYAVSGHVWAALAVAVTAHDRMQSEANVGSFQPFGTGIAPAHDFPTDSAPEVISVSSSFPRSKV